MRKFASVAIVTLATVALFGCGGDPPEELAIEPQSGGGGGVNPSQEEQLNKLPLYPGSYRVGALSNGAGTFVDLAAPATPAMVQSFYSQELPGLGWRVVNGPAVLPAKSEDQQQTAQTFTKDEYLLTIYANVSPPKGGEAGTILVMLRLEEI